MIIKTVEFAGAIGAPGGKQPPGALPHVAFSGRSNVGKSSLINTLLGRTRNKVARVSGTPGKTREVNFFRVRAGRDEAADLEFYVVDLPGYGYARVPAHMQGAWRPLIEGYLKASSNLRGVVQLIDIRHGPTTDDAQMIGYLSALGVPAIYVLTKADKVTRSERGARLRRIMEDLGADAEQVIPVSVLTGEGREELLEALEALIVDGGET